MTGLFQERYLDAARSFDREWKQFSDHQTSAEAIFTLPERVDRLARFLYLGRSFDHQDLSREEDHLATQIQKLAQWAGPPPDTDVLPWIQQYRDLWVRYSGVFAFTLVMFCASVLFGI